MRVDKFLANYQTYLRFFSPEMKFLMGVLRCFNLLLTYFRFSRSNRPLIAWRVCWTRASYERAQCALT